MRRGGLDGSDAVAQSLLSLMSVSSSKRYLIDTLYLVQGEAELKSRCLSLPAMFSVSRSL